MGPSYAIGPLFCVRLAGVPFEVLDRLGCRELRMQADRVRALEAVLDAANAVIASRGVARPLLHAVRAHHALSAEQLAAQPWLADYDRAARELPEVVAAIGELIEREHVRLHAEIRALALDVLPDFLAMQSDAAADQLERLASEAPSDRVDSRDREKDRTLAQYLQRVCAKNDTVSRFGPVAWGTIGAGEGLAIDVKPGIAARRVEAERWVVVKLAALLDTERGVRDELAPRLHPYGRLEPGCFHRFDEQRDIALTEAEAAIAARCDGTTPAHRLDRAILERLAEAGVIIWRLELMALDSSPLATLHDDVARWRPGPLRDTWLARLGALRELVQAFATDRTAALRLRGVLADLGIQPRERGRTLYTAANPISENCLREGNVVLGAEAAAQLARAAAPWFELYRDVFALCVERAYQATTALVASAPRRAGRLTYAALIAHAKQSKLELERDRWLVDIAARTFNDVKREFREQLAGRPDAPEWQLTADDCSFVRRRHALRDFEELALPSADLQLRGGPGRMQWVIAELHHGLTPGQACFTWSCPDPPALRAMLSRVMVDAPLCLRDAYSEAPVHSGGEALFALPGAHYVGAGRPKPSWGSVRPGDAEIIVDEANHDIRLRAPDGRDLGSLLRTVRLITGGMHPFFPFEQFPHAPRLVLGDVVVQRRAWAVSAEELGGRTHGISAAFVLGVERARAARGIPRHVYARPAPGAVAQNEVFAKDKDAKPIYVDLESVVFLDIFARRLAKYGAVVLTEMLPARDELCWQEASGSYSFELRTVIERRR